MRERERERERESYSIRSEGKDRSRYIRNPSEYIITYVYQPIDAEKVKRRYFSSRGWTRNRIKKI